MQVIEEAVKRAIQQNDFEMYYQPIVEVNTHQIIGVESLFRLKDYSGGPVSAIEAIQYAESNNLIVELGQRIIDKVFRQIKDWMPFNLRIGINISIIQLNDRNFIKNLRKSIDQHQINPKRITVEITESIPFDSANTRNIIGKLQEMKDMGIRIAIDDFTSEQRLTMLHCLVIQIIKLDKSIIDQLTINPYVITDIVKKCKRLDATSAAQPAARQCQNVR